MLDYLRGNNGALPGAHLRDEVTAIRRADDRASQRHDFVGALSIENDMIARWKETFESVAKTGHLPAEFFCCEHDSAQNCVQSRAITTTGQNTNPRLHLRNSGIRAFFLFRQHGRRQPIDHRVASHVAQGPRLHRIDLCYRAISRTNDADTQLSSAL